MKEEMTINVNEETAIEMEETTMEETMEIETVETTEETSNKKNIGAIAAGIGLITLPIAIIGCNVIKKVKAKKAAKNIEEDFDPENATAEDKVVAYRDALCKANARIRELESQLAEDVEAETITEEE